MVIEGVVKVMEEVVKVMEKKVMTVMEVCECDGRCGQGYGELSEGNGCLLKYDWTMILTSKTSSKPPQLVDV